MGRMFFSELDDAVKCNKWTEFRDGLCEASSWLRDMVGGGVQTDESDKFGVTTSPI